MTFIPINRRASFRLVAFGAVAAMLSACGGQAVLEPKALTADWIPLKLAVSSIDIADNSVVEQDASFITRRRADELRDATQGYLAKRYQAAGGDVLAKIAIQEARLVERELPLTEGLSGLFKSEPAAEIDGVLSVRITIVDVLGLEQGFAQARVSGARTVGETASVITKDAAAKELMGSLIDEMDQSLRQALDEHLGNYLTF